MIRQDISKTTQQIASKQTWKVIIFCVEGFVLT